MRAAAFLAAALLGSCATAWEQHDESLYLTLQNPSPATFAAHAELLKRTIDGAEAQGRRPPAGVCAEYAYYLARLGRLDEARAYVHKEQGHYPEARTFLVAFERFLEGVTPVAEPAGEDGTAEADR